MVSERGWLDEDSPSEINLSDVDDTSTDGHVSIDRAVLELDHAFSALSYLRQRYLVYALAENSEWTFTNLATKLVAYEEGADEATVDAHRRDQIYVSLHHMHISKLVDESIVTFDSENETIARADHAEQVLAVLSGAGASLDHAQEQRANHAYDSNLETDA